MSETTMNFTTAIMNLIAAMVLVGMAVAALVKKIQSRANNKRTTTKPTSKVTWWQLAVPFSASYITCLELFFHFEYAIVSYMAIFVFAIAVFLFNRSPIDRMELGTLISIAWVSVMSLYQDLASTQNTMIQVQAGAAEIQREVADILSTITEILSKLK